MSVIFREAHEEDSEGISAVLVDFGYERSPEYVRMKIQSLCNQESCGLPVSPELANKLVLPTHLFVALPRSPTPEGDGVEAEVFAVEEG